MTDHVTILDRIDIENLMPPPENPWAGMDHRIARMKLPSPTIGLECKFTQEWLSLSGISG